MERVQLQLNRWFHRIRRMPVLVLMPHSACNCRCLMCDIWKANKRSEEISPDAIGEHVRDWKALGVRWIVLSGGEALMHSNFSNLVAAVSALDAKLTLLSTGLLLERNAEVVAQCFDEVIVSLDGSEAVHNRIRNIPRAFEKLKRGINVLREQADDVVIGARCVIQRENYDDLPAVIRSARELDLNWISFLAADVSSEAFNRPGGWDDSRMSEVSLSLEQCDELETVLKSCFAEIKSEFDAGFVLESPESMMRILAYFRAVLGVQAFPRQKCNAPWVSAVVDSDLSVRPCFFHEPYGKLGEASFQELVNSPGAVKFRSELNVNMNPVCERCVCTLNI